MTHKAVTSADVAKVAGVSRSTVSRAFNPEAYVAPEVRRKVLSVAESLGYSPNIFARALISRDSPIVGIVLHDFSNPFHAELYSVLTAKLKAMGLTPLTAQLSQERGVEEALAVFRQHQVRRVVLTSFAITEAVLEACLASGLDVVLLNRADENGRTPAVCADLAQGGALAAAHLAAQGRRRIAILDGLAGSWTARSRAEGYLRGLDRHGLAPAARLAGDYSYACGLAAARTVAEARPRPDAVLAANDLCAFGMIDGLRRMGLAVPQDVAVVGFDDVPMAAWAAYDLTSVRLPVEAMTDRLCRFLAARRAGPPTAGDAPETTLLPCTLVARGTS